MDSPSSLFFFSFIFLEEKGGKETKIPKKPSFALRNKFLLFLAKKKRFSWEVGKTAGSKNGRVYDQTRGAEVKADAFAAIGFNRFKKIVGLVKETKESTKDAVQTLCKM